MEVEFSGNQEDDCPDCRKAGEATCTALGCLEQPVDGFQKSIGLARLRPSHDALQMCSDHSGNLFHRFDLGTHHAQTPMFQHGSHYVDLLALQNLAQLLLVGPRSGRSLDSHLGNQGIQISRCFGFAPMATSNSPTYGQSNSPRQDG